MSRAYRITVAESVRRDIVADDEVRSRLELLSILPPEETAAILRAELLSRDFNETDDGKLSRTKDSTTVTIDPCNGEVIVKVETKTVRVAEGQRTAVGVEDVGPGIGTTELQTRESLRRDLDRKLEKERAALQKEATAELERHLTELQPELGRIVNSVTREALKIQAARLGSVTEIHEDDQTGSLTIKVEV